VDEVDGSGALSGRLGKHSNEDERCGDRDALCHSVRTLVEPRRFLRRRVWRSDVLVCAREGWHAHDRRDDGEKNGPAAEAHGSSTITRRTAVRNLTRAQIHRQPDSGKSSDGPTENGRKLGP
jgi:hypothetical protein